MICPRCCSVKIVKNGRIHNGKPKFKGKVCGRQFVENPQNRPILDSTQQIIDKLLLERISLAGIGRALDISEKWLYHYKAIKYANTPSQLAVKSKKKVTSRFKWTNFGHLLNIKIINNGFGKLMMPKREK